VEVKLDRRKVRTRKMLRDALLELVLEKGYEAVTIMDITERADLRRATFYLHYKDKEELLLSALAETFDQLAQQIEPLTKADSLAGKTRLETFLVTFKHVEQNSDLYRIILGGQGSAPIARRIRQYLAGHIQNGLSELNPNQVAVPVEVLANYIAGVELALITWWLEQDRPYSAEQMAEMAQRLVLKGAMGVIGKL
jgi:AcrR family transcriptional regulator